jgi:hypothetical protein
MTLAEKTQIATHAAGILLCIVAAVCLVSVTVAVNQAGSSLDAAGAQVTATTAQLTAALQIVNRPCAPGPCGTLADVGKAVVHLSDITVAVQKQAQDSGKLVAKASSTMDGVAFDVQDELNDLKATTTTATGTLEQASVDLKTLNGTIDAAQPVLVQSANAAADFDALMKDRAIHETFTNVDRLSLALAGTTENVQGITGDTKRVTDDLTKQYFTPKPWWQKALPAASDGLKIGASIGCLLTRAC